MMQKRERDHAVPDCPDPAVQDIPGNPESAFQMVNKYGTYEIQPTSDADWRYPSIHQGLPRAWRDLREGKPKLFGEDDAAQ
ncbi:MAG: hypothetical protein V8S89_05165 [Oscillospiraceae bacterium]